MGPRSHDRGNQKVSSRSSSSALLQWGRDPMIAEMMDSPILDRYIINLQWGRDPMIAETERLVGICEVPNAFLQWGRGQMTAEIAISGPGD